MSSLGQFVLAGEPVAVMGDAASRALRRRRQWRCAQPVLYVEFRKDGDSDRPGPWWAHNHAKR